MLVSGSSDHFGVSNSMDHNRIARSIVVILLFAIAAAFQSCKTWQLAEGPPINMVNRDSLIVGEGASAGEAAAYKLSKADLFLRICDRLQVSVVPKEIESYLFLPKDSTVRGNLAKEFLSSLEKGLQIKRTKQVWKRGDSISYHIYLEIQTDSAKQLVKNFVNVKHDEVKGLIQNSDKQLRRDQLAKGIIGYVAAFRNIQKISEMFGETLDSRKEQLEIREIVIDKLKSFQFTPPYITISDCLPNETLDKTLVGQLVSIEKENRIPVVEAPVFVQFQNSNIKVAEVDSSQMMFTNSKGQIALTIKKIIDPSKDNTIVLTPYFENYRLLYDQPITRLKVELLPKGTAISPESVRDSTPMRIVSAGEVELGSREDDEIAEQDEIPRQKVWVDEFLVDIHEVTNKQYRKFMQETNYQSEPKYWHDPRFNQDDQPVVGISWVDAQAYAQWSGKRLPTEAEWEKGAAGPTGLKYPWGNEFNAEAAVSSFNSQQSQDIGSHPQGKSPYGLLDMAGNVWEWCLDWYDPDMRKKMKGERNPQGPPSGLERVVKGGSWRDGKEALRCANRMGLDPSTRSSVVGFRCARSARK